MAAYVLHCCTSVLASAMLQKSGLGDELVEAVQSRCAVLAPPVEEWASGPVRLVALHTLS